jgi:hypothetical protein
VAKRRTCETCRWWTRFLELRRRDRHPEGEVVAEHVVAVPARIGRGECRMVADATHMQPGDGFGVWVDTDIWWLETEPDFGCVRWEARK